MVVVRVRPERGRGRRPPLQQRSRHRDFHRGGRASVLTRRRSHRMVIPPSPLPHPPPALYLIFFLAFPSLIVSYCL
jgi:hypothetical protein